MSGKYRKLDIGCFTPSSVVPLDPTTTKANLPVPTNLLGILDVPAVSKPLGKAPSKASATWAKPYPIPPPPSSPVKSDWPSKEDLG